MLQVALPVLMHGRAKQQKTKSIKHEEYDGSHLTFKSLGEVRHLVTTNKRELFDNNMEVLNQSAKKFLE